MKIFASMPKNFDFRNNDRYLRIGNMSTTFIGSVMDTISSVFGSYRNDPFLINIRYLQSDNILKGDKYKLIAGTFSPFKINYNIIEFDIPDSLILTEDKKFKLIEIFKDYSRFNNNYSYTKSSGIFFPYISIKSNEIYNYISENKKTINYNKLYDLNKFKMLTDIQSISDDLNKIPILVSSYREVNNRDTRLYDSTVCLTVKKVPDMMPIYDYYDFSEINKYALNDIKKINKNYVNIFNDYTTMSNKKIKRIVSSIRSNGLSFSRDCRFPKGEKSYKYIENFCKQFDVSENELKELILEERCC